MDHDETRERFGPRRRAGLHEMRAAWAGTAADRAPVEPDQGSVGRLSRQDALRNQAMAAAQEARRAARAVEAALHRLPAGDLGWCEAGGEPIGERRLDLDPTLTRRMGCAR